MQALQLQILQLQQENARLWQDNVRLQKDNAEYERFSNWAMGIIDEQKASMADLQSTLNKWIDMSL